MVRNVDIDVRKQVINPPQHMTQPSISGLDRQIDQAIVAKPDVVIFNMSALQSLDSASLNWMLAAQNRLAAQGIQMIIANPSPLCADVFLATRLDHRFKIQSEEPAHA